MHGPRGRRCITKVWRTCRPGAGARRSAVSRRFWPRRPGRARPARLLEEARFKAGLDARSRVRARRWAVPWQRWAVGALVVAVVIVAAVQGAQLFRLRVAPLIAQVTGERRLADLLAQAGSRAAGGELRRAEADYQEALALAPGQAAGSAGLEQVADAPRDHRTVRRGRGRRNRPATSRGAGALHAGDRAMRPGYRDTTQRIVAIKRAASSRTAFSQRPKRTPRPGTSPTRWRNTSRSRR